MKTSKPFLPSLIEQIIDFIDIFHQSRISRFFSKKNLDILIDIGAHKGEFTLHMLKNNNLKKIYLFEAQSSVFKKLKENLKPYQKNLSAYNIALNSYDGVATFYENILSSTSSFKQTSNSSWVTFKKTVLGSKDIIKSQVDIETYKFDTVYMSSEKKIDQIMPDENSLFKIDVEGCEFDVLKGADEFITKRIPKYIQIEENTFNIYQIDDRVAVRKFLKDRGYIRKKSFLFPLCNFKDIIYQRSN